MRHSARVQHFSRTFNHRKAMMRNLVVSLVEHERISTTVAKAKELRRWVEKAITLGKRGSLGDRRLLLSRFPNELTVKKVFEEIAPRFKDRAGGYTRILRTERRPGDNAEMAYIEFVDFKPIKVTTAETQKAAGAKKAAKGATVDAEAAKKRAEQKASRKEAKKAKAAAGAAQKTGASAAKAEKKQSRGGSGMKAAKSAKKRS
jgi:large subunit ribosomal protein L17